ncbi:mediator complex subunit Med5-domain-containing protein [Gamsiella multidivaricata]|uniref:mediator complex subunit Med5-domain-containing protein n=1 Tax=Gamsiella multidivaricata TaxID=101098 RepID=UPI00221FAAE3|nr:mediator complex subunit Med5-domain-containing protein [Gamsiella multidivaricata]KAI7815866.1 mediator complex subunit Med5-domain-containing protein [Gamsiella multidivaricata]
MDPWTASTAANGETEGLAAADLTYLAYSLASSTSLSSMTISSKKPIVPDVFVVQRIKDIRRIKGLELDVVLLQFWLAGLTGLAESNSSSQRLIWKSLLLVKVDPKYYVAAVFRSRRKSALRQLSFYRGILNECDESVEDGTADRVNILKAIAIGCQTKGLVRPNQLDILNDVSPSQDSSNNYKFIDSSSLETIDDLCGRTLSDFEHQEKLVDRIIQVCENACTKMDVFVLSKLCQTLDDNPMVLDLIHLLRSPSALLNPLERFVNNLQQNEDNDIDTCNSNLEGFGIVLILILTIIRRYELAGCLDSVLREQNRFCYLWLHRTSATIPTISIQSMDSDMHALMGRWITALFDSMGISDGLIQTSKPQMLLEISPSIFEQSLAACQAGVIDATTLNSGLDYFLQPCLLFVLIGVVQYLCEEILFSTPSSFPSTNATSNLPGSVPGQSMLSPIGHAISPLASRGAKPPQHMNTSTTSHGQGSGKSVASVAMLQSCLKSLLAGEAFPLRLMRLLKSEVLAVLEHQTIENDHQMVIIQERLAAASANYYPWSVSEAYDVPKLAQQTSLAYEAIVSGGRTSLIARREKGWHVFGGSCYHIDVDLFRTTLCYLGPAQFVTTILKQLLKAARTPHGRRAGAAMISTPLVGCGDEHLAPQSLLWTLIYQTLWIPVPGRLETFSQGKLLAEFVGMTLDLFQSRTLIQLRQNQLQKGTTRASKDTMDIDMVGPQAGSFKCSNGSGTTTLSHDQLERDAAVEPFRVMLDQRLRALEPITRDRPGFEGFAQGMRQYRQRHPPLTLPLHQPKKARRA